MKKFKIEIKWSLLLTGSMLLWMVLERLAGLHDEHIDKHQYITILYLVVPVFLYVFALRDKRKNFYGGKMTYKQGFISGIVVTFIVTLLSPLTQWIISYVITPDYFENVIEYALESGYHKNSADAETQFNFENYAVQSTVGSAVTGLIITSVVAFFTKTKSA